jgi:hypothetical protein
MIETSRLLSLKEYYSEVTIQAYKVTLKNNDNGAKSVTRYVVLFATWYYSSGIEIDAFMRMYF